MDYKDDEPRSHTSDPQREERSVNPEVGERELEELESGQRADREAAETGDDPIGDEDVTGSEPETSE